MAANPSNGKNADGSCRDGFTKDYEGKFCVSTMSSCYYKNADHAYGLRTFDPDSPERCRFMGCYTDYTVMEWDDSGTKSVGYYCAKNPDQYLAKENVGILNKSTNAIVSKNNPTDRPETIVYPGIKVTYECAGPDSLIVSDPSKTDKKNACLQNWSNKRAILGDCYIANGKGRYDKKQNRCVTASCHPGFASSFDQSACVDLNRRCWNGYQDSYLAQQQEGFLGEPRSVCLSTSNKEFSGGNLPYQSVLKTQAFVSNASEYTQGNFLGKNVEYIKPSSEYLMPTVVTITNKPGQTKSDKNKNYLYSKDQSYDQDLPKEIFSWNNKIISATGFNYVNGYIKYFYNDNISIDISDPSKYLVCENMVDSQKGYNCFDHDSCIWAKGSITQSNSCQITSCKFRDPIYNLYEKDEDIANGLLLGFVNAKDKSGNTIDHKFEKGCLAAPINENDMILNSNFTLVRRPDDFYTCDAKSLTGTLLKSNVPCRPIEYMNCGNNSPGPILDSYWDNPSCKYDIDLSDVNLVPRPNDSTCDAKKLQWNVDPKKVKKVVIDSGVSCDWDTYRAFVIKKKILGADIIVDNNLQTPTGNWTASTSCSDTNQVVSYSCTGGNGLCSGAQPEKLINSNSASCGYVPQSCSIKASAGWFCKDPNSLTEVPQACSPGNFCKGGTAAQLACDVGTYSLGGAKECTACINTPADMKFINKWKYVGKGSKTSTCDFKVVTCKVNSKLSNDNKNCVKK